MSRKNKKSLSVPVQWSSDFSLHSFSATEDHRVRVQRLQRDAGCSRKAVREGLWAPGDIVVVDPHGAWMHEWNEQFRVLRIPFLRSTMREHSDMEDEARLWAFAHERGDSAVDLLGGLPAQSKQRRVMMKRGFVNQTDAPMMQAPGTACFRAFQERLVDQLKAGQMVVPDKVVSLAWCAASRVWTVLLASGKSLRAQHVVSAAGGALAPMVPEALQELHTARHPAVIHSSQLAQLERCMAEPPEGTTVVVGGGLTAAHVIAGLAANMTGQTSRIVWLTRSELRVQPFDVDFAWFSRFSAAGLLFDFHALDMAGRAAELRRIKRGSIPPAMHRQMQALIASGRLQLVEGANITGAAAAGGDSEHAVRLTVKPKTGAAEQLAASLVVMCTGTRAAAELAPYLASVRQTHPLREISGLPCLEPTLQWGQDLPLFIMGPLAALCLGPYARNLRGARLAADRIADQIFGARAVDTKPTAVSRAFRLTWKNAYAILDDENDTDSDTEDGNSEQDDDLSEEAKVLAERC
jgi:hypothetical protein